MSPTLARTLAEFVLRRLRHGSLLIVDYDGTRRTYGTGTPAASVTVHSPQAWRELLRGSLGMADSYVAGMWDSPDLVALVRLAARNSVGADTVRRRMLPLTRPRQLLRAMARPYSRRRAKADIAAHYDLGEQLYTRMLDPTMMYSCALFERPRMTLEQAQLAKLELICERLELGPEDRVLEIGTGWGGFAIYAAASRGCHITTTTISRDQYEIACQRVREAGLEGQVTVLLQDYRDLRGGYDKLVSIEMIEAVGWRNTGTFLGSCSRLLEPHGAMLLQSITIDDRAFEIEKASRSFIKERIFPGGSLPSMQTLSDDLARHTDMQVAALQDITAHYVPTLARWRAAFEERWPELAALGYDTRFQRLWRMYLAYCEAGFAERRICDVQLLLTKPFARLDGLASACGGVETPVSDSDVAWPAA